MKRLILYTIMLFAVAQYSNLVQQSLAVGGGQNHPPSVTNLVILPSLPYETENLFVHYNYFDEDGDIEEGSKIAWYKNGTGITEFYNKNMVPSSATSAGERWYFTIKSKNEQESREIQSERTTILPYSYAVFPHDTGPVNKWKLPKDAIMFLGKGSVTDMNYSPDGKYLAVSSEIGVWIYDAHSNWKEVTFLLSDLSSPVYSITFSPDGRILALGCHDGSINLWDINKGEYVKTMGHHDSQVSDIVFSPDMKTIISKGFQGNIKLWDVDKGECIKTIETSNANPSVIIFIPDLRILTLRFGHQNVFELWDVERQKRIRTMSTAKFGVVDICSISSFAVSPDGRIAASGSPDGIVRLWDMETGDCIKRMIGHTLSVDYLAFSPDGKLVASGGKGHTTKWEMEFKLWDLQMGKCIVTVEEDTYWNGLFTFSSDSKIVALGGQNSPVRLWDIEAGICIKTIEYLGAIESGSFSPDGKMLASGSSDSTIRLWNVETGEGIKTMEGHTNGLVRSVAFSPDGNMLASGGQDDTIRLWNVETGESMMRIWVGEVWVVAFSPDGKMLASGLFGQQQNGM